MSEPLSLPPMDEGMIIIEVERLRRGYTSAGRWTLEQTAWHCSRPLVMCLNFPATTTPTQKQSDMQTGSDEMIRSNSMPDGLPVASTTDPVQNANPGPGAVDELIAGLRNLQAYDEPLTDFGPIFGPTPTSRFRGFVCMHTVHHLRFLIPSTVD